MERENNFDNILIINDQPEFVKSDIHNISADYFVLQENNDGFEVDGAQIAGVSVLDWVVRACENQPKLISLEQGADPLQAIRPYINLDKEYSVVLYSNTPLVCRNHILDLLGFVSRKNLNSCKLKRGFVFKNEYISQIDEIYSVDCYDFSSNDFFEVDSSEDFSLASEVIKKRIISFNKSHDVLFENDSSVEIDANIEIGANTFILSGANIENRTIIGNDSKIKRNTTILGSKIGSNVIVGNNCIISNSIIKDGTIIGDGVIIKDSVVSEKANIGLASKILNSSIKSNAIIMENVVVDSSKVGDNSFIAKHSKILGDKTKTIIGGNCIISANSVIIDSNISSGSVVESNQTLIG